MDIEKWLTELGLGEHVDAFAENGVDTDLLVELSNEDLKDLGVSRLVERKLLLREIGKLVQDHPAIKESTSNHSAAEGERRQVTVLFADLSGFTKLSNELGAEATHELLNSYFAAVDSVVESYGGTVDKHIGDSVMAIFGAPIAHDDDPARAVRTAIDIHKRMGDLSAEADRVLHAHIGIASGQVVASGTGSASHREYTVTGDSVNLASRLQDRAKPGETLVSEAVHGAVSGDIDCRSAGEIILKGLTDPIRVWKVGDLRVENKVDAGSALVGRQAEMAQFEGVLEACRRSGRGQGIIVRSEAGLGKTRLVEEFLSTAAGQGFVTHRALVLNFGVGKGQDAIRSLVNSLIQLTPSDETETRQKAAADAISHGPLKADQRVFLIDLLNLEMSLEERKLYDAMDNKSRNEGKRRVVSDLLRHACEDTPAVVVIEDIHWADSLILNYLAALASTVAGCKALLVMTSRIEGYPLDQTWRAKATGCSFLTMDLVPLRTEDALSLATNIIDSNNQFALDCVRRAEGNPLFLEQLLRNAREHNEKQLPASIQSLVLARMDRLSQIDKRALQAAAVLGQRFSPVALSHLIGVSDYTCDLLVERQFVRPEGDDFLFSHALLQEGVYDSLLKATRAQLHRDAAEWCGEGDLILRAEHLDRAEDPAAAMAYFDAALAQTEALHFETALRLSERGSALAKDPISKSDLLLLRGDALRNIGATEESIALFENALATTQDDIRQCRSWIGMAQGLRVADRQKQALDVLEKAEAAAVRCKLLSERAQIHYLRGNVFFPLGRIDDCLKEHEKALSFAREVGSPEGEALALGGLGDAHYLRGHMRSAYEQFRACVGVCREHGYRRIEVANRHMMGWTRIHLMEFREALEDAIQAASMAAEVSHHRAELLGLMLAGKIELELGNFDEAEIHLDRAIELARTLSAGNFEAQTLIFLSDLSVAREEPADAKKYAKCALDVVDEVGTTFIGPTAFISAASLNEDADGRIKHLEKAEQILDTGCVAHNHFWFTHKGIDDALMRAEWDQVERYAARLETYTREQKLGWSDFLIARGRALSAWGSGVRTNELKVELEQLHGVATNCGLVLAAMGIERALKAG